MSTPAPRVAFENVTKTFYRESGSVPALGPVTFDVLPGEFVALLGPSGCGKSTTLNMTAGLMAPSGGTVAFGGKPVASVNTKVGYLTQRDTLLPWRNVYANVALPLEIQGSSKASQEERVGDVLEQVGLAGFAKHYPTELSGGMRRRAAIARMLVSAPDTLLLDEPFGALDAQLKMTMHEQLLTLWQKHRKTVMFVTHDIAEALILADRVIVFSARPGRIKAAFKVDLSRPRDVYTLQFEPYFVQMQKQLWEMMRDDVAKGEAM